MKTFMAIFWRHDSQYEAGGYATVRPIDARTKLEAKSKAEKIAKACADGSLMVEDIIDSKEW